MKIYFAEREADGLIKIGFSKDVDRRLRELEVSENSKMLLINQINGNFVVEKLVHAHFDKDRVYGEWFRFSKEMLSFTVDYAINCGCLDLINQRTFARHMSKRFQSVQAWLTEEQAETVQKWDQANRAEALGEERKDD